MAFGGARSIEDALRMGEEMQQRIQRLQESTAGITGEGRDSSGLIQVTVGMGGVLADVHVNPRAMRLASQDLADGFKEAHLAASQALADRVAAARREAFDGEDPLAEIEGRPVDEVFAEMRRTAEGGLDDALAQVDRLRRDLDR